MEWKKTKEILNNDIDIPKVVEDKFTETANKIMQMEGKERSIKRNKKWVAAVCSVILVSISSVVVLAGTGFFERNIIQEESSLVYTFELDYELTVHNLKVTPEYLPEGYEQKWIEGKYSLNGESGAAGITIQPVTSVNLQAMGSSMNFYDVKSVETIEINGMEADIVFGEENEHGNYGNRMLLFNQTDGYVIVIYATNMITTDELIKVASNLKVEVMDEVQEYMSESEAEMEAEMKAAADTALKNWVWEPNVVKPENIMQVNEEMKNPLLGTEAYSETADLLGYEIGYTVTNIEILDSVAGLDTENFYDYEGEVSPCLNEDGTLKSYERITRNRREASEISRETATSKFVAITVRATNYSAIEQEMATNKAIVYLEQNNEGNIQTKDTYTEPASVSEYTLQKDNMPIYIENSQNMEGEERLHNFFNGSLNGNETDEYTFIFVVDEDKLEEAYFKLDYGHGSSTMVYEEGIVVIDDSIEVDGGTFVKIK